MRRREQQQIPFGKDRQKNKGNGKIKDGVLSFKFKDSFDNEGVCKLQSSRGVYQLDMVVTKVVEASPLHFYGTLLLRKTSDRTISP